MRFSIIIPIYNVENYIEQCVQSVLDQDYTDFEIICVDDGTPDDSARLCEKYLTDSRVHIYHKSNGGQSSARNAGIKCATGEYLIFLDSDDYWRDVHALSVLAEQIDENHPDVIIFGNVDLNCVTGEEFIHQYDPHIYSTDEEKKLLIQNGIFSACAWNKVIHRSLFSKEQLNFIEGIVGEDNDWCARLLLFSQSIATSSSVPYVYRKYRNGSITSGTNEKYVNDLLIGLQKCFDYAKIASHEKKNDFYWGYVAFFYVLIIGETSQLPRPVRGKYLEKLKTMSWLLRYNLNKKTILCYWINRFLGYSVLAMLLGSYYRIQSKIK